MATTIAVANQKGGVGKTTTAVNLAASLAGMGRRVLLVDLDGQKNASTSFGIAAGGSLLDALIAKDVAPLVVYTAVDGLHLIPASDDMQVAERQLAAHVYPAGLLKASLAPLQETYDYIFLDCPPALGVAVVAALAASDGVVVPVGADVFSLGAVPHILDTISEVKGALSPDLEIAGLLMVNVDKRTRMASHTRETLEEMFPGQVFAGQVRSSARVREAPGTGQPLSAYDPSGGATLDYRRVAAELESRLTKKEARVA